MIKSILSSLVIAFCLSGFAAPAFADDMAQVRQDCEDEVAGYGLESADEQKQAVADCVAMRTGSGEGGSSD